MRNRGILNRENLAELAGVVGFFLAVVSVLAIAWAVAG